MILKSSNLYITSPAYSSMEKILMIQRPLTHSKKVFAIITLNLTMVTALCGCPMKRDFVRPGGVISNGADQALSGILMIAIIGIKLMDGIMMHKENCTKRKNSSTFQIIKN